MARLDKEFQTHIVHPDRPENRKQVTEQLRARGQRRAAEGHVAVEPEPREKGQREGQQHSRHVRRNGHEAQVDQPLSERVVVDQEVAHPSEQDVRPAACGVAEHLSGYDGGDGTDVEPVDQRRYEFRHTHQRAE